VHARRQLEPKLIAPPVGHRQHRRARDGNLVEMEGGESLLQRAHGGWPEVLAWLRGCCEGNS
jgi:hypothetical protein